MLHDITYESTFYSFFYRKFVEIQVSELYNKLGICILYGFLINRTEKKKGKKTLIFLPFRYVDL